MKIEPLDLNHFEYLYPILKDIKNGIAEYSFANLFLFRKKHCHQVLFDKEIFIWGVANDGEKYIIPMFKVEEKSKNMEFAPYITEMIANYGALYPIAEQSIKVFDQEKFSVTYREEDSDYIYSSQNLWTYAGRKLHGQRNLSRQFARQYNPYKKILVPEHVEDAVLILSDWLYQSGSGKDSTDYVECLEALNLMERLALCGYIFYAENEPAGFLMGEEAGDNTFLIHFAKGRRKFKGVYPYMYSSLSELVAGLYSYINMEQDLGNPSLKKAKLSYHPDYMLKKYRVRVY